MTESPSNPPITPLSGLLTYYCHEMVGPTQEDLLEHWLELYSSDWVRLALIESLYQGRYKTTCVDQLLAAWERRGQPCCHYNLEFESLVCHNLPDIFSNQLPMPGDADSAQPSPMAQEQNSSVQTSQGTIESAKQPQLLEQDDRQMFPWAAVSTETVPTATIPTEVETLEVKSQFPASAPPSTLGNRRLRSPDQTAAASFFDWLEASTFDPERTDTMAADYFQDQPQGQSEFSLLDSAPATDALKFQPIDQFMPELEQSELYQKLTEIAKTHE